MSPDDYNKTGGSAFPTGVGGNDGMTIRDYFAAAFLQGFAATYKAPDAPELPQEKRLLAVLCYGIADAMLEARRR